MNASFPDRERIAVVVDHRKEEHVAWVFERAAAIFLLLRVSSSSASSHKSNLPGFADAEIPHAWWSFKNGHGPNFCIATVPSVEPVSTMMIHRCMADAVQAAFDEILLILTIMHTDRVYLGMGKSLFRFFVRRKTCLG